MKRWLQAGIFCVVGVWLGVVIGLTVSPRRDRVAGGAGDPEFAGDPELAGDPAFADGPEVADGETGDEERRRRGKPPRGDEERTGERDGGGRGDGEQRGRGGRGRRKEIETTTVQVARAMADGGYGLVTTAELAQALEGSGDVLLVDTRSTTSQVDEGQIEGSRAFRFPMFTMDEWDAAETDGKSIEDFEFFLGPDKDRTIVFFCRDFASTRSHNAATWAVKLGYKQVLRYPGGHRSWQGAQEGGREGRPPREGRGGAPPSADAP